MRRTDLLLHPIRIRILHAFSGDQSRTTSELCARLPGVSPATVYRHVGLLAREGVLEVIDEQPVRGSVERRYRLDRTRAKVEDDAASALSLEDHRRAFASALAALIADFGAYLDQDDADPSFDQVGYRQLPLWLTRSELKALIASVQRVIAPVLANRPTGARQQYLLSPILFPVVRSSEMAGEVRSRATRRRKR